MRGTVPQAVARSCQNGYCGTTTSPELEEVMNVGLIGLGRMGTGIAKSLLRAGHRVTVYNRTPERAEALRKDGATVAASIAEACRGEAVLTMLADDAAVEAVVFGEGGVLKSLARGQAHISLSTISVDLSDRLASEHAKAGQEFVSAPVFGRPEAAEAGKLFVVAAGPRAVVDRCKPLWEAIGQKLLVIGEQQSKANVVKLTGNFMIATVLETLGEALAFARKSGVDAAALLDFLTSTLFNAPIYKTYGGLVLEGKYDQVGFALPLGFKDLKLVMEAADAKRVPMPIASVLHDRFVTALARGHERRDWSVLGEVAAEDAGLARAQSA
jgi:3-hydroxyisobutyrate dehydrogenase-like beta-hydroxyacid dehydrogenase